MSETLTYQETPKEQLNEAEQEALEVGEQMEQEQQQLLAGKYKSSEELEKAYLELQKKLGSNEEPGEAVEDEEESVQEQDEPEQEEPDENTGKVLTEADVDYLHNLAGGKKGYQSMLKWAAETLNQKEISMYDRDMDSGDTNSDYFAVQAMVAEYNDATGTDGKLLTGKGSPSSGQTVRSQHELVTATSDPRHDNHPA